MAFVSWQETTPLERLQEGGGSCSDYPKRHHLQLLPLEVLPVIADDQVNSSMIYSDLPTTISWLSIWICHLSDPWLISGRLSSLHFSLDSCFVQGFSYKPLTPPANVLWPATVHLAVGDSVLNTAKVPVLGERLSNGDWQFTKCKIHYLSDSVKHVLGWIVSPQQFMSTWDFRM